MEWRFALLSMVGLEVVFTPRYAIIIFQCVQYIAEVGVPLGAYPLRSEPRKWEAPAIYWRYQTVS
jgi:hypothetical protein